MDVTIDKSKHIGLVKMSFFPKAANITKPVFKVLNGNENIFS